MIALNLDPTIANSVAVTRIGGSIQVMLNGQTYTFAANAGKAVQVLGATGSDQINIDPTVSAQFGPQAGTASAQGGASGALSAEQMGLLAACGCGKASANSPGEYAISVPGTAGTATDTRDNGPITNAGNDATTVAAAVAAAYRAGPDRAGFDVAGFAGRNETETALPNATPARPLARTAPQAVPAPSTTEDGAEAGAGQVVAATPTDVQAAVPVTESDTVASQRQEPSAVDRFFEEQLTPAPIPSGETAPAAELPGQPASPGRTAHEVAERGGSRSWQVLGLAVATATALAITRHEMIARRADRRPAPLTD
jgi:hypothetical protein